MPPARILIVKLSSLGDILHALPTVHALRAQLGAEIHWAVQPEYAALVRCFPDVSRVIAVPRRRWWRGLARTAAALRRDHYDLAVDLQGLFKSAFVTRLARATRRIGPSYAREGAWLFYTARAGRPDRRRHAVEQAMDVLDHLGLERPARPGTPLRFPEVSPPGEAPRIALLPVSRWETKNWPAEHFAVLARRLAAARRATILVLGGADDHPVGEIIRAAAPGSVHNLCGRHSLPETFGVLSRCDLLIANDSGPVHMAAALGRPCLVLFGPTRPEQTGPYGAGHRVLSRPLPCRPCLSRRCRLGGKPCLAGITPEEVLQAALPMLPATEETPARA